MSHRINRRRSIVIFISTAFFLASCYLPGHAQAADDAVAFHAMVASAHPIASAVGIEILQQGGNAVDAAIAVAFALSIAEPNASGIGGGGFMIIKMADQREPVMIDYREMAPGKATPGLFYQNDSSFHQLTQEGVVTAIGVPGLVAGADLALKNYGTLSLRTVLQPAIRLARYGVPVSQKLTAIIAENYEKIMKFPATASIYLSNDMPLEPGTILRNEDLARSLELLAEHGPDMFYRGEIAERIVSAVKDQGGILELQDFNAYQAKQRKPVIGTYRGYQIISASPVTGGGTHLIELLNIMEGFKLKKMGHNAAEYIHLLAEAMKMVYADKAINTGDPDFCFVPVEKFIAKKYARQLRKKINKTTARFDYIPPNCILLESNSTSHLSVIDEHGNMVALTQSINNFFGSGLVVPGTGILLNDHLSDFDDRPGRPNSIAPYKRPTSSIAPTIILKKNKPFMTLGTPGGTRIISALAQIIMNVIDFGMSMDEAIEAPRVHCFNNVLHVEGRIPMETIERLRSMGHTVKIHPDFDNYFGGAQGILVELKTKLLYGGADSRRDGVAIGF